MKKADLERELRALGWWLHRQGGSHEIWTNGEIVKAMRRHREIQEHTARAILRVAALNPGGRLR
jgi:mRNA interferase HicA